MPRRAAVVAVVVAGIVGTVANSVIVAALTPNGFLPLAVSPGRNAVAIAVAVLLPVIYVAMSGVAAAVVAIVALTVIPSTCRPGSVASDPRRAANIASAFAVSIASKSWRL